MSIAKDRQVPVTTSTDRLVFAVKLPDDLVSRLQGPNRPKMKLVLGPNGHELVVDETILPVNAVRESQRVDIASTAEGKNELNIVGSVKQKLMVRQELAQSKMEQIRVHSEEAEKARLSRRTVSLEEQPKTVKKRTVTNNTMPVRTGLATKTSRLMSASQQTERHQRSTSEKDSQHSWSPDPCLMDVLTAEKPRLSKPEAKSVNRKPPSTSLLPSRPIDDASSSRYHQLVEEFGRRYHEYLSLDRWINDRLVVFRDLQKDLETNAKTPDQAVFKLLIEERRLAEDEEYQEKSEKLDECCAALLMIKSRLRRPTAKN